MALACFLVDPGIAFAVPSYSIANAPASVHAGEVFTVDVLLDLDGNASVGHEVSVKFTPRHVIATAAVELGAPPYQFNLGAGVRGIDNSAGIVDQFEAAAFTATNPGAPFAVGRITFRAGTVGRATIIGFFGDGGAVIDDSDPAQPIGGVVFNGASVDVVPASTARPAAIPTSKPGGATPTAALTADQLATSTEAPTATATPTAAPTATPTATPTAKPTATPAITPTATPAITPTATPAITSTATPKPISIPLTRAQQTCVNAMNENGENVDEAQLDENERCLRDFQMETLVAPMTFGSCMTADRMGRVKRAAEKTVVGGDEQCETLDVPPPFGHTNAATVNAAAVEGARALAYAIFGGPPVLDHNLVTRADDPKTAECQLEMLERADELENSVLEEVNKAKRRAIADETVASEAALAARLQAVFAANDEIKRVQGGLGKGVDGKCAGLRVSPDSIFPGACGKGGANLDGVKTCVIAAARCQACLQINAFDALNLDCDQADDQAANASCP